MDRFQISADVRNVKATYRHGYLRLIGIKRTTPAEILEMPLVRVLRARL